MQAYLRGFACAGASKNNDFSQDASGAGEECSFADAILALAIVGILYTALAALDVVRHDFLAWGNVILGIGLAFSGGYQWTRERRRLRPGNGEFS